MNNFFRSLSLPVKILLIVLIPLALIIYLSFEIYKEKAEKVEMYRSYIDRINSSSAISELLSALQLERRYSYEYSLKKDIDSRARIVVQRPVTDLAIKTIEQQRDTTLKDFKNYTFLNDLHSVRTSIDRGTTPDAIMQFYTTAIFRINTINTLPVVNNKYLDPVFHDLTSQRILLQLSTYLGIIRSNFYNVLFTNSNQTGVLYGLQGVYDVFISYEKEFLSKASPKSITYYKNALASTDLGPTLTYIHNTFKNRAFDTLYTAEEWWQLSAHGTDQLMGLQRDLLRHVKSEINSIYNKAQNQTSLTLVFLILALVFVFVVMAYTTHIITQMLKHLDRAAQNIAIGAPGGRLQKMSDDVIGHLSESISRIDENNKQLTDAADAIGKGNFNIPIQVRSDKDALGHSIIRMRDNLKRFTMEVEKTKEQFRQVADTAPVMIWMVDENKQCNFVNTGWLKFTGRKKVQEFGYGWIEGMHPDDYSRCLEVFEDAFNARERYYLEYRFRREDGEYRWLSETATPRYSPDGKFEGYIGTCIDIHEMKIHEQRKDDFIKMASHELKTPVTSIKGYVQLLLSMFNEGGLNQEKLSADSLKSSLATIDKQVVKLTRLMSELLDLSRIETGKLELSMQPFNLEKLTKETIADLEHTTKHSFVLTSDIKTMVNGDKDRIAQVLLNIFTNAIKYSPTNKAIRVRLFHPSENYVAVSVRDEGIGIDKKDHSKIFERFYRVEGKSEQTYPGFGIGLFIANEIIHRHKGTISVESDKGAGSTFTFVLPIHTP